MFQISSIQSPIFPPDFLHGNITVETVYSVYGEKWVENAVFIIQRNGKTTWAAFNDYFLEMGQGEVPAQFASRSSKVVLGIGDFPKYGTVNIHCSAGRLAALERDVLGAYRESEHYTTDLLSFVSLCGALGIEGIEQF